MLKKLPFTITRRLDFKLALLVLGTIAVLLPFSDKAFHIDDPMYIWAAKQILKAPGNFYGFDANWDGFVRPMSEVMQNPPGVSWVIALVASIFGWSERAIHCGFLIVAAMSVMATYRLAQKLCGHPAIAALVFLFSPVFMVSATNVMADVLVTGLFTYAAYFWVSGLKEDSFFSLVIAAVVSTLAALTKYFGLAVVPLLLAYTVAKRKLSPLSAILLLPLAVMIAYQAWVGMLYGGGGLADAASYVREVTVGGGFAAKIGTALAFTGGCFNASVFTAPAAWGWRKTAAGAAFAAIPASLFLYCYPRPLPAAYSGALIAQYLIFFAAGCGITAMAIVDFRREKTPESLLLLLWFAGTIFFATFINWTVSARHLLPAMPAAAILLVRHLERRGLFEKYAARHLILPLTTSFVVAVCVAWADYRLAGSARIAAETVSRKLAAEMPGDLFFEGHWGFQYYMEQLGWQPVNFAEPTPHGQVVVVPLNNSNVRPAHYSDSAEIARFEFPTASWISTMSKETGAGFYSDRWGPLPFVIGPAPTERYRVFRMKVG